jgi:hypothetical protein
MATLDIAVAQEIARSRTEPDPRRAGADYFAV